MKKPTIKFYGSLDQQTQQETSSNAPAATGPVAAVTSTPYALLEAIDPGYASFNSDYAAAMDALKATKNELLAAKKLAAIDKEEFNALAAGVLDRAEAAAEFAASTAEREANVLKTSAELAAELGQSAASLSEKGAIEALKSAIIAHTGLKAAELDLVGTQTGKTIVGAKLAAKIDKMEKKAAILKSIEDAVAAETEMSDAASDKKAIALVNTSLQQVTVKTQEAAAELARAKSSGDNAAIMVAKKKKSEVKSAFDEILKEQKNEIKKAKMEVKKAKAEAKAAMKDAKTAIEQAKKTGLGDDWLNAQIKMAQAQQKKWEVKMAKERKDEQKMLEDKIKRDKDLLSKAQKALKDGGDITAAEEAFNAMQVETDKMLDKLKQSVADKIAKESAENSWHEERTEIKVGELDIKMTSEQISAALLIADVELGEKAAKKALETGGLSAVFGKMSTVAFSADENLNTFGYSLGVVNGLGWPRDWTLDEVSEFIKAAEKYAKGKVDKMPEWVAKAGVSVLRASDADMTAQVGNLAKTTATAPAKFVFLLDSEGDLIAEIGGYKTLDGQPHNVVIIAGDDDDDDDENVTLFDVNNKASLADIKNVRDKDFSFASLHALANGRWLTADDVRIDFANATQPNYTDAKVQFMIDGKWSNGASGITPENIDGSISRPSQIAHKIAKEGVKIGIFEIIKDGDGAHYVAGQYAFFGDAEGLLVGELPAVTDVADLSVADMKALGFTLAQKFSTAAAAKKGASKDALWTLSGLGNDSAKLAVGAGNNKALKGFVADTATVGDVNAVAGGTKEAMKNTGGEIKFGWKYDSSAHTVTSIDGVSIKFVANCSKEAAFWSAVQDAIYSGSGLPNKASGEGIQVLKNFYLSDLQKAMEAAGVAVSDLEITTQGAAHGVALGDVNLAVLSDYATLRGLADFADNPTLGNMLRSTDGESSELKILIGSHTEKGQTVPTYEYLHVYNNLTGASVRVGDEEFRLSKDIVLADAEKFFSKGSWDGSKFTEFTAAERLENLTEMLKNGPMYSDELYYTKNDDGKGNDYAVFGPHEDLLFKASSKLTSEWPLDLPKAGTPIDEYASLLGVNLFALDLSATGGEFYLPVKSLHESIIIGLGEGDYTIHAPEIPDYGEILLANANAGDELVLSFEHLAAGGASAKKTFEVQESGVKYSVEVAAANAGKIGVITVAKDGEAIKSMSGDVVAKIAEFIDADAELGAEGKSYKLAVTLKVPKNVQQSDDYEDAAVLLGKALELAEGAEVSAVYVINAGTAAEGDFTAALVSDLAGAVTLDADEHTITIAGA